jgi:hypothetical protein
MKPRLEFNAFRIDACWYDRYWWDPKPPAAPSVWAEFSLGAVALLRRAWRHAGVPAVRHAVRTWQFRTASRLPEHL